MDGSAEKWKESTEKKEIRINGRRLEVSSEEKLPKISKCDMIFY